MDSLRDPTTSILTIVPVTFSATRRRRRLSDWRRVRVDGPLCHISGRGGRSSCAFHSAVSLFFRLKGLKQKQPTTTTTTKMEIVIDGVTPAADCVCVCFIDSMHRAAVAADFV